MKTVLLSDVHGCLREMQLLLSRVDFSEEEDKLIFLGDMMDRGFHSYETYKEFVRLKEKMGDRCILCRGNHDHNVLVPPSSRVKELKWILSGRILSDFSFRFHGSSLSTTASFMESSTVLYHEEELFLCVHAGIVSERLSENSLETLLYDHSLVRKNLYQGKLAVTGHIHCFHPQYFDGSGKKGEKLSYGEWKPLPKKGVICIDTGCAELNRLTAMVVEEDQYRLECVHRRGL